MNDATALILFNLIINSLQKEPSSYLLGVTNIVLYFVKVLLISPCLGTALGFLTVIGLRLADKHLLESDTTVQIALTICCAYLSFYWGELLHVNGVLTCCISGVVIAWLAPTLILEKKTMTDVWEMITWVSNTMIFLLAVSQ